MTRIVALERDYYNVLSDRVTVLEGGIVDVKNKLDKELGSVSDTIETKVGVTLTF